MQNALSVPNAASVRIDIDVRQDVAYAEVQPNSRHEGRPWHLVVETERAACLHLGSPRSLHADQSEQLMVHHSGPPE